MSDSYESKTYGKVTAEPMTRGECWDRFNKTLPSDVSGEETGFLVISESRGYAWFDDDTFKSEFTPGELIKPTMVICKGSQSETAMKIIEKEFSNV